MEKEFVIGAWIYGLAINGSLIEILEDYQI